jgi:hypothetical protein
MYPKAAVDVSMLVPFISHAQIPNPVKCKIPLQSPPFSRFQPKNHPLDSTKTQFVFTYYSQSCRVYQGQAAEALVGDPNANNKFWDWNDGVRKCRLPPRSRS